MELENNISNNNKIPGSPGGCDSFTRPEEIAALGKFLSNIKKVQEEHTKLDNSFHDITGKFPDVQLEDKIEELRVEKIKELTNKIISLEATSDPSLDKTLIGLDITDTNELEDTIVNLEDNRVDELGDTVVELEDSREDKLEDTIINLEDDRVDELESTVIDLEDSREDKLGDVLVKLLDHDIDKKPEIENNTGPEVKLSESIEKITNIKSDIDKLGDQIDTLDVDKKLTELDQTTIEKLDNIEETSKLSSKVEVLEIGDGSLGLDNTIDRLKPNSNLDLNDLFNFISDLEIEDNDIGLSDTIEGLEIDFDIKLPGSTVKLDNTDSDDVNLSDTVLSLKNTETTISSLSNKIEDLEVISKDVDLDSTTIFLDNEQDDLDLEISVIGLDNYWENIGSLEDFIDGLRTEPEDIDLPSDLDKLSVPKNNIKLEREKLNLDIKDLNGLSKKTVLLDNVSEEVSLSDVKEVINISEISALSKYTQKLEIEDELDSLSDSLIGLGEAQDGPREKGDYDFFQNNREKSSETELPGELKEMLIAKSAENDDNYTYFDPNIEGNKLYDSVLETPGEHKEIGELESDIISPENDPDDVEILGDKIKVPIAKAATNDDKYKYLDIIKFGDDGQLYDAIMDFGKITTASQVVDGAERMGSMKGWLDKVKSLVHTYLSPQKDESGKYNIDISEHRAKQFEQGVNNATKIALEVMKMDGLSHVKEEMPKYKLQDFSILGFNMNDYLRYAAEEIINFTRAEKLGDGVRETLLREVLALLVWARDELEIATKAYRSRLPGNEGYLSEVIRGGLSVDSIASTAVGAMADFVQDEHVDPMNRPTKDDNDIVKTIGWRKGNDREANSPYQITVTPKPSTEKSEKKDEKKGAFKKLIDTVSSYKVNGDKEINYNFLDNYVNYSEYNPNDNNSSDINLGMKTTLEELVGLNSENIAKIESVEGLFELLKASEKITTASSVTTDSFGNYKVMTLDSNNFWEITLEPYVGQLNGYYTFLPLLDEAAKLTSVYHGYDIKFNGWLPIVSFDLQKSKLVNKTLGLSDGEISYPTSIEYTNELRLTIVDDQYKTWRNYFELCMQSMVYSCTPKEAKLGSKRVKVGEEDNPNFIKNNLNDHLGEFFSKPEPPKFDIYKTVHFIDYKYYPNYLKLTAIDKNYQLVSPYKNITFLCKIYVMTPQKSTINKYELLLTLKDFSEERSGEIDGSGTDLSLSFSIVGENPPAEWKDVEKVDPFATVNERKTNIDNATAEEKKRKSGNLISGLGSTLTSLIPS